MSKRFPFPIPFGWFGIAHSDELQPGDIKSLRYFGRELVLFRGEDGAVALVNAFCPHLGAHLGQGQVSGEHIVCPFHAWEFDAEGQVANIPYCEQMPGRAKEGAPLRAYPTVERNHMIYAWYHPEGKPPAWEVVELPEAGNEEWAQAVRKEWVVNTIPQELSENVADPVHFLYV
ncbi:MAG: Rieske 2Fe-2S domain-containing protein, partial [Oceanisphaera sp.]|nr:Rieske 2Fe-2S domain-containing protein [Oceanisphaera sp.]